MKRFIFGVLPLVLTLVANGAGAQETLRIAAVVNDEMISAYDLNMRLGLIILLSGLPNTGEVRQRIAPQILQTLIDEEIKRQEVSRLEIPINESEIERALQRLERVNGLEKGSLDKFLSSRRIDKSTLIDQIESQIGWRKLISGRFARTIQISDEEIDEVLAEIEKNKGKPEFLVAEIFLPVDRPDKEPEALKLANRLIQQARAGANFQALAQNFSKSPTAERGGVIGWSRLGQLGGELDKALARLQLDEISPPIRTEDGYYILFLKDRRTARGLTDPDAGSTVVNLQQLFLPIEKGAGPTQVDDAMEGAKIFGSRAKSCQDLDKIGKELDSPLSGNLGNVKVSTLAPQQRMLVRGLPPLKASLPLRTADGVIVLMVCKRTESKKADSSPAAQRDRIGDRLFDERMGLAARQHNRDLRRAAFVDIRL